MLANGTPEVEVCGFVEIVVFFASSNSIRKHLECAFIVAVVDH